MYFHEALIYQPFYIHENLYGAPAIKDLLKLNYTLILVGLKSSIGLIIVFMLKKGGQVSERRKPLRNLKELVSDEEYHLAMDEVENDN
ncbi:MAG: hypothetical protein KJ929_05735 [Euryarchaeota archaeon]|nr:hypothetical protein [Euryarchaeota archaeon]